jgi:hypothetical protein
MRPAPLLICPEQLLCLKADLIRNFRPDYERPLAQCDAAKELIKLKIHEALFVTLKRAFNLHIFSRSYTHRC